MSEIMIEVNLFGRRNTSLYFVSRGDVRKSFRHEVGDKTYDELFKPEPEPMFDSNPDRLFSAKARWDARNRRRDEYIRRLASEIAFSLMDSFRIDREDE